MNIRNDSPFAKLNKEQRGTLLELSKRATVESLVDAVRVAPNPIHCSISAMRRFLRRVEQEEMIEEAEETEGAIATLAKKGENPVLRDATLATVRQKMLERALETNNRELLM